MLVAVFRTQFLHTLTAPHALHAGHGQFSSQEQDQQLQDLDGPSQSTCKQAVPPLPEAPNQAYQWPSEAAVVGQQNDLTAKTAAPTATTSALTAPTAQTAHPLAGVTAMVSDSPAVSDLTVAAPPELFPQAQPMQTTGQGWGGVGSQQGSGLVAEGQEPMQPIQPTQQGVYWGPITQLVPITEGVQFLQGSSLAAPLPSPIQSG